MNLREFRKRMNKARKDVSSGKVYDYACHAVAGGWSEYDRSKRNEDSMVYEFCTIFCPVDYLPYAAWLAVGFHVEKNKLLKKMSLAERRILFIDAFQGYCESEKLYKKWD